MLKKSIVIVFLLLNTLGLSGWASAVDFERDMEAAQYLEEYQSRQSRNSLISKGILVLLLAAGGIAVGLQVRRRKIKKNGS